MGEGIMTGIVWDGVSLSADKQLTTGNVIETTTKVKVIRLHTGELAMVGLSGSNKAIALTFERLKQANVPSEKGFGDHDPNSVYGILVMEDKAVYDIYGDGYYCNPRKDVVVTMGSAWEVLR